MTATGVMYNLLSLADGLNDKMIAAMYAKRFNDTIGVADMPEKLSMRVYINGAYEESDSLKIVDNRISEILHHLKQIAENVISENWETAKEKDDDHDTDDDIKEREKAKSNINSANKIISYVERMGMERNRTGILTAIKKIEIHSPIELDANDRIIPIPNGSLIIDHETKTITYDPDHHKEALNTLKLNMPYIMETNLSSLIDTSYLGVGLNDCWHKLINQLMNEWQTITTEMLSYRIGNIKRPIEDTDNIKKEVRLLRAWAGYQLYNGNPEQMIFNFVGSTGSGKGTLMNTFCGVWGNSSFRGRKEIVVMDEKKIKADLSKAVSKRTVFADEFNKNDVMDTGLLKYITNPVITVEEKYKNPVEKKNNMKLTYISNYENKFDTPDGAILRRFARFKFYKPRATVEDPLLPDKYVKLYGPIILLWAIEGLRDILTNGGIKSLIPEHLYKDMLNDLLIQDRIALYLATRLPKSEKTGDSVLLSDAFKDMRDYFENLREVPPATTSQSLGAVLRNHGYDTYLSMGTTKIRNCILMSRLEEKLEGGLIGSSKKSVTGRLPELDSNIFESVNTSRKEIYQIVDDCKNNFDDKIIEKRIDELRNLGLLTRLPDGSYVKA